MFAFFRRRETSITQSNLAIVILCGLSGMTALSIEIILPMLGLIARDFDVPPARGAYLISLYFVSFGAAQLFWGALSDRFGRLPTLYLGLVLFVLASIGCALAPTFEILLACRLLQGAAGAAPIIARSIVRDVLTGPKAARQMAVLTSVSAAAPLIAPTIGSGLLILFNWRASFYLLAVVSAILLLLAWLRLPETVGQKQPNATRIPFMLARARILFTSREFVVGTMVSALMFGAFSTFLSLGSLVAENYGIAPESFGSVYAIAAAFFIAAILLTHQFVERLGLRGIGSLAMAILCVAVAMHTVFLFWEPEFTIFWAAIAVYLFAFGFVVPTATTYALQPAHNMTGFASSLLGSTQMLVGAAAASLATLFFDGTGFAISLSIVVCGAGALLVFATGRAISYIH
ncbi:Bcr/CflA family efflux MFS transporter [Hoeflea sp. CAU 1731]